MVESYNPSDLSPGMQRNKPQCVYWEGPYITQVANSGIPLFTHCACSVGILIIRQKEICIQAVTGYVT